MNPDYFFCRSLLTCPFKGCGEDFSSATKLRIHMYKHFGERPYGCREDGCKDRFTRFEHVEWHMKAKHGLQLLKCEECPYQTYKVKDFDIHMGTHDETVSIGTVKRDPMTDIGNLKIYKGQDLLAAERDGELKVVGASRSCKYERESSLIIGKECAFPPKGYEVRW
eukprot:Nk52_evm12s913 gene=Nk52_evmTU12s913